MEYIKNHIAFFICTHIANELTLKERKVRKELMLSILSYSQALLDTKQIKLKDYTFVNNLMIDLLYYQK